MKITRRPSESGQVLVLIVLALVALLGFTALAIDGGMIYSERRIDQNAADAAALAGAAAIKQQVANAPVGNFQCASYMEGNANWVLAVDSAIARAAQNNFIIGPADAGAPHGDVELICNAPDIPTYDANLGKFVDVHTRITKPVSTSLMHLFYNGPAVNTVESVVRLVPHDTLAANTAILALRDIPDCGTNDKCLQVNGSIDVEIIGGVVASNSNVEKSGGGGANNGLFRVLTGNPLNAYPSGVLYGDVFSPGPELANAPNYPGTQLASAISIPTFLETTLRNRCAAQAGWSPDANPSNGNYRLNGGTDTIHPGKYNDIVVQANGRLTLSPGLYCVNSVSISSNSSTNYAVSGEGVTFFMDTNAGKFEVTSSAMVRLTAPTDDDVEGTIPCNAPSTNNNFDAIQGLLIWSAAQGTNNPMPEISLSGTVTSDFEGTIVAPYTRVKLSGNVNGSDTLVFHLQVIAYDVWLTGNSRLSVDFNNDLTPRCGGTMNQQR